MGKTLVHVLLLISFVGLSYSVDTFPKLIEYVQNPNTKPYYPDPDQLYSEYIYGDCVTNHATVFYGERHFQYWKIRGKVILRGWLDIKEFPSCIILRGRSFEEDNYRATAFNFQICVARIRYIHSTTHWSYYYYEWYIPNDMTGSMNWDIFFYGPEINQSDPYYYPNRP